MSAKAARSLASLRPSSHRASVAIKVKVEPNRSPRPASDPLAPSPAPVPPAATSPKTKTRPTKRAAITELPTDQRRRLMWGVVGVGMVVVVVGWSLTFGATLRDTGQGGGFFSEIIDIFRTNQKPQNTTDSRSEEIRQLEEQVFPQFQ